MRSFISINCVMFLWFSHLFVNSPVTNNLTQNPDTTNVIYGVALETPLSYEMIDQLSIGEIEKKTGKKLSLKEKMVLLVAKRKIKKSIKKGMTSAQAFEAVGQGDFIFEWKYFLWGILLGPLTVIYVFAGVKRNRRSALASSSLGCLIWLAGFIWFLFAWSAGG